MNHPWFQNTNNKPPCPEKAAYYIKNLAEFKASGKWKKIILQYIADHFSVTDEENEL